MKHRFLEVCACWLAFALSASAVTPTILSPPQSVTVNNASAAAFTVVASNAASYQWQFSGTNVSGTNNLRGATNATLSLDNVTSNQAGSYTVVVTSSDNISVTSAPPAVLTLTNGTIVKLTFTGYTDGSSNNFLVQLFDHDKPATVENFIHYITSGEFNNMFWSRCVPGFVLQGGDFDATDRTNTTPGVTGTNIAATLEGSFTFPDQVDNEFNVGPLIHNTFGTVAMAKVVGEPDSAHNAFFFNLADNSANLDNQNGGFTVFGRIVSDTNVLLFFNSLNTNGGGIIDYTIFATNSGITSLPVNYTGTNEPANANLYFCDFAFQTPPPVDTNPPTVAFTYPPAGAVLTNGSPLTITGTASDNVGLARVRCDLYPQNGAYGYSPFGVDALGTTLWSFNVNEFLSNNVPSEKGIVQPGIYNIVATSQDGAGNLSQNLIQQLTITAVTINGNGTVKYAQYGTTDTPVNAVGANFQDGVEYALEATPGAGATFVNWSAGLNASLSSNVTFSMSDGLLFAATFVSNAIPAIITLTNPAANAQLTNGAFNISGTIAGVPPVQVTCRLFSTNTLQSIAAPVTVAGTNSFSFGVTNLAPGNYIAQALAQDAQGNASVVMNNFTVMAPMTIITNMGGVLTTNGPVSTVPGTHTLKAAPIPGYVFYSWNDGVNTTLNPSKTIDLLSNLTLTVTFVPEDASLKGITFTYPLANAKVPSNTFNRVEVKAPASLSVTQMTCQLFLQSNGVTASPQPVTDHTANKWTFPVTNLTPGPYTILAVAYDDKGNSRLVSENFNLLAKLAVEVQPPGKGTVTAGLNGKYLEVGKTYNISATPKSGQVFAFWTGGATTPYSAATTFVMSSNTVLTANFTNNLFPAVAGTYTGLFFNPANVTPTNAGFVTLTTTRSGAFSGKLMFPSRGYSLASRFIYNGFNELRGRGLDSNTLIVNLNLDLTNDTDTITGYVMDQLSPGLYLWSNSLILYRATNHLSSTNAPVPGKYVVLLQPENATNGPVTDGYAAISLGSGGALALGGTLPDNTAISESAKISKAGIWHVYIVPASYKGKGMIIGWQTNTPSGGCNGRLFWVKPEIGSARNLASTGAKFEAPVADTNYQMVLAGGITNSLPVNKSHQFVPVAPITGISLLPTGVLSGHIDLNGDKRPFKGAFISPSEGGAGFILETGGQTDPFEISIEP